jgi:hypothetical protein
MSLDTTVRINSTNYYNYTVKKLIALNMKISLRNYYRYKLLYSLLVSNGLYGISLVIKKKIVEYLNSLDVNKIPLRIRMELSILSIEEPNANFKFTSKKTDQINNYLDKLTMIFFKTHFLGSNSSNYNKYLKGKQVAIVGPTSSIEKLGYEIDTHDIVIRPKFKKKFIEENIDLLGSKTNVSYYQYESENSVIDYESLECLDYVVNSSDKIIKIMKNTLSKKTSVLEFNFDRLWSGYTTHIQKILVDVILNKEDTSKVKLYNFNFYMSKNLYLPNYNSNPRINSSDYNSKNLHKLWTLHSWHDILSNWKVLNMLVNRYNISITNEIKEYLNFSDDEFMGRMDSLYGFFRD